MTKEEIELKEDLAKLNAEFEKAMQALNECNREMQGFSKTVKEILGK